MVSSLFRSEEKPKGVIVKLRSRKDRRHRHHSLFFTIFIFLMIHQQDRYRLHQFYSGGEVGPAYVCAQKITDEVFGAKKLKIVTLAMDFIGATEKYRKQLEAEWIATLPTLDQVTHLSVRHRVSKPYFEAICEMKNLEHLHFWTAQVEDIASIGKLRKLRSLGLSSFSRLTDLSTIAELKQLTHLSIDNSFNIASYDCIGKITTLVGLSLSGDMTSPKTLRLASLRPFTTLKKLKHLNLPFTTVVDQSYDSVLEMPGLERFDTTAKMPRQLREKIRVDHPTLEAGFFMDWDFDNKRFYEGKLW
jgi:hypothetical protein